MPRKGVRFFICNSPTTVLVYTHCNNAVQQHKGVTLMQTLTLTQLHNILSNAYVLCDVCEYDGTAGRQFVQQAKVFASLQELFINMQYEWEQHCTYDSATNTVSDSATAIPLDLVCNTIVQHLVYWDDEWEYYFTNVCTAPSVANYAHLSS